jgi:uncharacterized damage-inducible protein DinB
MDSVAVLRRLHQHRAWVNEGLLKTAAGLGEEQLKQPLAIGQGSIWRSLYHMYGAEYVWLGALEGNESPTVPGDATGKLPGNQELEGGARTLAELTVAWRELEARWQAYLGKLSPASLDDTVYKKRTSSTDTKRYATRRADILLHVCTHAHYTAAQVINMFRQCGVTELPPSMLIQLARDEAT